MEEKSLRFAIIGADMRQYYLVLECKKKGFITNWYEIKGLEDSDSLKNMIEQADVIIVETPFRRDETFLKEFLSYLHYGQYLFGGVLSEKVEIYCAAHGIKCFDFMKEELIAIFNAIATAEGAIAEAICNSPMNLHGAEVLVLGYGRCGKVLADKLRGLSAKVSVGARSPQQLAFVDAMGMKSLDLESLLENPEQIGRYAYIFNTISSKVLGKQELSLISEDVLILDVASKPGGVDFQTAQQLGRKALHCLGIPGKYAPKISADKMFEYVLLIVGGGL